MLLFVYGSPEILVHDQEGEFWSDIMTRLAELLDIQPFKDYMSSAKFEWHGRASTWYSPLHVRIIG